MFRCEYQGVKIEVEFSDHAFKRVNQRGLNHVAVFGSIVAALDHVLNLKNGEEFCVIDKDACCTTVCGMEFQGETLVISVITVVNTLYTYTKDGQKMITI